MGRRTRTRPASAGSTPTTTPTTCSASCAPARTAAHVACIANFSAVPHHDYRVGLPDVGPWAEILNTDAEIYYGSGVGNLGGVEAEASSWHGRPASATVQLPPLGTVWLRWTPPSSPAEPTAEASDAKRSPTR